MTDSTAALCATTASGIITICSLFIKKEPSCPSYLFNIHFVFIRAPLVQAAQVQVQAQQLAQAQAVQVYTFLHCFLQAR